MPQKTFRTALTASLLPLAMAACSQSPDGQASREAQAAAPSCDRACLIGAARTYLDALADHRPSETALAGDARFVENLKPLQVGEGLWKTMTEGPTEFSIFVPDETRQEVGWLGMIEQSGKPALLALRLKLNNGRITEAEHVVGAPFEGRTDNLRSVRPGLLATIPSDQQLMHDRLITIARDYYDALDDNDGSKAPFAADCERHENGMITAGANAGPPPNAQPNEPRSSTDCAKQLDSGTFTYIDTIDDRRVFAADPTTGLVMGLSHFHHPMTNLPYTVTNTDGSTTERNKQNMPYEPFDFAAAHIFKVGADGKIHEIEASGITVPFNSPTGWEGKR